MSGFTDKIISLFHLDSGDKVRKYGYFAGSLSTAVNLVLFAVKLVFGIMLNSVALIADAVHSLSDVATSVIILIGFRISAKPPDRKHPFGHGRAEPIVSLIIACALVVVGYEFLLRGVDRIHEPQPIEFNWLVVAFLFLSIVIKEMLFSIAYTMGQRIGASSLKADAWHHRSDGLSTLLVIIGFFFYRLGIFYVDGILCIVIALFIVFTGIMLMRDAASYLMGEAPPPAFIQAIRNAALECDGVTDIHHIHVHNYGDKTEITVHIRLKPDTHLDRAHEKATEVESCIRQRVIGAEVTVHVEPRNTSAGST